MKTLAHLSLTLMVPYRSSLVSGLAQKTTQETGSALWSVVSVPYLMSQRRSRFPLTLSLPPKPSVLSHLPQTLEIEPTWTQLITLLMSQVAGQECTTLNSIGPMVNKTLSTTVSGMAWPLSMPPSIVGKAASFSTAPHFNPCFYTLVYLSLVVVNVAFRVLQLWLLLSSCVQLPNDFHSCHQKFGHCRECSLHTITSRKKVLASDLTCREHFSFTRVPFQF